MSINAGDVVEDFELEDQNGVPRRLSALLAEGPVVLFFYPAALSTGCTAEACTFRDLGAEFREAGAQRVGISRDKPEKQKQFSDKHSFDYPLLSDPDGKVASAMGVKRKLPLGPLSTKRMTFVIDTDRRVLEVIHSETNMNDHAARALEALAARKSA
ncbi:putative peroxidoxin BcpB [Paractinoplanes abujensis]|uniref:thioredoxin-dependent peroxiredoxin n=1 Tax=Paractinoplanes abujensis TaxID=882441 RepID=A0A7W7G010_9ACTN|nr:peroxiredoxin [Actinoplanes abujensis]MBB4690655.1 peroxiredoxin Q/BCP [Actinoplanes abujensis]GID17932.1 putative peroxidoxin BcpB [Actinoplanes abujensis]